MGKFYDYLTVPKNPIENAKWRLRAYERAAVSPSLRKDLLKVSRADCLWWINFACFLYEPRSRAKLIPFSTWPHQDPLIRGINECIDYSLDHPEEKMDFGVEKSRGEGVTWICLMVILWRWLFEPGFACGLVSRNEDAVDSAVNPDALMPKLDWQLRHLQRWMRPDGFDPRLHRRMKDHSLLNPANGATIVGFPATGDVGAGGRKGVFFLDEMGRFQRGEDWLALSSTQYVTDCRGLVGSYRGEEGAFYKTMKQDTGLKIFKIYWWDNPTRTKLLYRQTEHGTEPVDPRDEAALRAYEKKNETRLKRLRRRGFHYPGQTRSPWYDGECDRGGATPYSVAEELDCNPAGAKPKVFDRQMLDRLRGTVIQPPHAKGELTFDEHSLEPKSFVGSESGRLSLWTPVGADGKPPLSKYALGSDLSVGTGGDSSSNSTIVGIDYISGSQVLEFVTNRLSGGEMAEYMTALAKWFHGAIINWENMGPGGSAFHERIIGGGLWGHLYYERDNETHKLSKRPGYYHNSPDKKYQFLSLLSNAMDLGDFIPRSEVLIKECTQFEMKAGKVVHIGEQDTMDEAGKGAAHGDVVIGAAMAWLAARDLMTPWSDPKRDPKRDVEPAELPRGSYAYRRHEADQLKRNENSWLNFG